MAQPSSPAPGVSSPVSSPGSRPGHRRGSGSRGGSDGGMQQQQQQPPPASSLSIPQALWRQSVPLLITHAAGPTGASPFVTAAPRFSYLSLLLPRLSAFFGGLPCSSFHHEEVQLRNLAVGLLVDLYQPASLPWRLVVGDGPQWDIGDTFLNGVKEADFVRNGNAKQVMSMSKEDTTALWNAVQDNDYVAFSKVNAPLLNPAAPLKHVPVRIYLPTSPAGDSTTATASAAAGSFRVIQTLIPPRTRSSSSSSGRAAVAPQTVGPMLRGLLPSLFPSSRDPVLANVILHGAPVPFSAPLEDLMREAAYPDGWLCFIVLLL